MKKPDDKMNFNFVMNDEDMKIMEEKLKRANFSKEEFLRKILEFTLATSQIKPKVKRIKSIRGQFRADRGEIEKLQAKAEELGYSASELIIRGIREYKVHKKSE
jgi:hypothetical protein